MNSAFFKFPFRLPVPHAAPALAALLLAAPHALHAQTGAAHPPPLADKTAEGFLVPHPNPRFEFPRDHGSHPGFKIEWWYLTGHLYAPRTQARYGFQATFFRRASVPNAKGSGGAPPEEAFGTGEVYLYHAALSDLQTGRFHHSERVARVGWDAWSSAQELDLRVGPNRLRGLSESPQRFQLDAHIQVQVGLSVFLTPQKPLVIFGENGVSRKGTASEAASWYLTFPRMEVQGRLRLGDTLEPVTGSAWMDHEISSSQLTAEQAGWDWAGIQLEDGREIMVYRLRRKDGSTDPASALFWVDSEARTHRVGAQAFRWTGAGQWRSPRTKAAYPLPVRLSTEDPMSGKKVEFVLEPLLPEQELDGAISGVPYWEGACRVLSNGQPVGSAYVELTGYAGALSRALK